MVEQSSVLDDLRAAGCFLPSRALAVQAGVAIRPIRSTVAIDIIDSERGLEDGSLDSRIRDVYRAQGYASAPSTPEEAAAAGQTSFNAMQVSCPKFTLAGDRASMTLQPTRYLTLQAWKDLHAVEKLSAEDATAINPRIAGGSLIAIARHQGEYIQICQIKGKALGSGQVHAALAAGGFEPRELHSSTLIADTQRRELMEEIGLSLAPSRISKNGLFIHEYFNGFVSVANFVRVDLDEVLDAYASHVQSELSEHRKLEALGLSIWHPIAEGIALTTLDGRSAMTGFREYIGTDRGLETGFSQRTMRPITEGWLGFLSEDRQNLGEMLELAGF